LPKKTAKIIKKSGNDYTMGVKENQPTLLEEVKKISLYSSHKSFSKTIEKNRGRIELREAFVHDAPQELKTEWEGISKIIRIERVRKEIKKSIKKNKETGEKVVKEIEKITEETAYFISSKDRDANYFNEGIRLHWGIENSLHYVKDVTFKEDASKIKKGNSAENLSLIRNIAINIFRGEDYDSMAQAVRLNCNKIKKMYEKLKEKIL
jgi:predicted transposase YbfD/YdcC